ncbi:MAG: hypothetical protein J3K34DRAFT_526138 [Monoraphidium minutum]|nr:MAG: hypothetical protein J3K34DRAFT_526138 [Monoraphidium minutum]
MLQRLAGSLPGLAAAAAAQSPAAGCALALAAAQHACGGAALWRALPATACSQRQPWPHAAPHHHHQQQQQQLRGYAAAKAKGKQQQKGGAKGKKGAPAPKKKVKARLETKPFDDKDPLLQRVVSMLVPQERASQLAESPEAAAAAAVRAKAYSAAKMAEHKAWRSDLASKLALKRAALAALPPALRASAAVEDLEPLPLTRHALYETPPEAYRG